MTTVSVRCRRLAGLLSMLMLLASSALAPSAFAASGFTGPYEMQHWSGAGPGNVSISPSSGPATSADFNYFLQSFAVFSTQTWSYQMTAPATGNVTFNWNYHGFHAFFQVRVFLRVFSNGPGGGTTTLVSAGPANCCSSPSGGFNYSGTASIHVNQGSTFGLQAGGSNFDSDDKLFGTITVSNFNGPVPDTTPPVVTLSTPGSSVASSGWYNRATSGSSGLTVQASAVDDLTGVTNLRCSDASTPVLNSSSGSGNFVLHDGAHSVSCSAADGAGNTGAAAGSTTMPAVYKVDETPPVIAFSGNAGSYTVDQTVGINCSATDATSGIDAAHTSCPNTSGPAYSFNLGPNTVNASATDNAGNSASASTTFTVIDNVAALNRLIAQFVSDPDQAASFQSQVTSIGAAPNANAKAGKLGAFTNHVNAQTGKLLTSAQAQILIRLAGAL